jgi:serine/threonine protein kinase
MQAERAVMGNPNILSPDVTLRIAVTGKGSGNLECSVYTRAQGSATDLLSTPGALAPNDAVSLLRAVRAGIAAMHEVGFAHRDVKHRNVLFFPGAAMEVAQPR